MGFAHLLGEPAAHDRERLPLEFVRQRLPASPTEDLPEGWNSIPGARGCTWEACDFRDHYDDLRDAGATLVFGLSSQDSSYQSEVVNRLRLPFRMLSDEEFQLADALRLPTFNAPSVGTLYSRLTLIITGGRIEHVFYPIFPPNEHAQQVLDWLRAHPFGRHGQSLRGGIAALDKHP